MAKTFSLSDVFISYSRKDSRFVRRLDEYLRKENHDVWVDWEDIPATAEWWDEIEAGIEGANTFLFVISPDSVNSDVCYREIDHAIQNHKRFVPLLYRDVEEPSIREKMHPVIHTHNWLYFRDGDDFDQAFARLMGTLQADLSYIRTHTRLLVRAREWDARNRDASYLISGTDAQEADMWLAQSAGKEPRATELQAEYILASRAHQARRQRRLLLGVTVALVVALGLMVLSFLLFQQSQSNLALAEFNAVAARNNAATSEANANLAATQAVIAANNASTATLALGRAQFEADNAQTQAAFAQTQAAAATIAQGEAVQQAALVATQAEIALNNAATATIAQGEAQIQAGLAQTQAARATIAQGQAVDQAFFAATQAAVALNNAATATIAQGEAQIQADNAATQAQNALNNAATATIAQGEALAQAALAATQAAIAQQNASTATVAQGEAVQQADLAATQAEIALNNAATATIAQGEALEAAETVVAALSTSEASERLARAQALAVSGEQAVQNGNYDLALGLALASSRLNPDLVQTQRLLNQIAPASARLSLGAAGVYELSPNSRHLAAVSGSVVNVWDVLDRQELIPLEAAEVVNAIAFSPDGSLLASASEDGTVTLWSIPSGEAVMTLSGHDGPVNDVTFSPDGARLLTAGDDNDVILWNAADGAEIRRYSLGVPRPVFRVEFTAGGRRFLAWEDAGGRQVVLVSRDTERGNVLASTTELDFAAVDAPNGYALDTVDNRLAIWDAEELGTRLRNFGGAQFDFTVDRVGSRALSPDGRLLLASVTRGDDPRVRLALLDVVNGSFLRNFDFSGTGSLTAIAFSPDSRTALCGYNNTLILWDVTTGREIRRYASHNADVTSVAFTPDGHYAVSQSVDGDVRVWDLQAADNTLLNRIQVAAPQTTIVNPAFSPDGRDIYAVVSPGVMVWNRQTGEETSRIIAGQIFGAAYDAAQPYAVTVQEQTVRLFNLEWPSPVAFVRVLGEEADTAVQAAAFSPDGHSILIGSASGLELLDRQSNNRIRQFAWTGADAGFQKQFTALAVSPDNTYVVGVVSRSAASDPGTIILWDAATGAERLRFPAVHTGRINSVAINPAGDRVLTASDDETLILWDTDGRIVRRFAGHADAVRQAVFSPDGQLALSGSDDASLILWDVASGERIRAFRGHTAPVTGVAFSPDGRMALSASEDDTLVLWRIESLTELVEYIFANRYVRTLTEAECSQYAILDCTAVALAPPPVVEAPRPFAVNDGTLAVNLRNGDSFDFDVIAEIPAAGRAEIIGISSGRSGWYRVVTAAGIKGWVSPSSITVEGDVSALKSYDPPPPIPEATPTPSPQPGVIVGGTVYPDYCANFRITSPLDSLGNPQQVIYWNQIPVPADYWVSVFDEFGAQLFITDAGDTNSQVVFTGEYVTGPISQFTWEVNVFVNGQLACPTQRRSGPLSLPVG